MDTQRLHILVIDDLTDAAESTAEVLALWGYDAAACVSGEKALARARVRRPDAVILDLAMPRMDGFRFAELFRELPHCEAVPLIAVSGHWSLASSAHAFHAGISHYLLKPADLSQLKFLLAQATRGRATPSALQVAERGSTRADRRLVAAGAAPA